MEHRPIFTKAGAMIRVPHISDLNLEARKNPVPSIRLKGCSQPPTACLCRRHLRSMPLSLSEIGTRSGCPFWGRTHIDDQVGTFGIYVNGSHDFYGSQLPDEVGDMVTIEGMRFAPASPWTCLAGTAAREAAFFPDFSRLKVWRVREG